MTKKCKIHKPYIMWLIVLKEDYHDYCYPSFEILINYLLKKYDITYEDIEVLISTEYLEDSDVVLEKVRMNSYTSVFLFKEEKIECEFGSIFNTEFKIDENIKKLYIKVIPLEEI
jgi:hypothetical protein